MVDSGQSSLDDATRLEGGAFGKIGFVGASTEEDCDVVGVDDFAGKIKTGTDRDETGATKAVGKSEETSG